MNRAAARRTVQNSGITESNRRVVGRVRGTRPGPMVLVIAGLHGNEPAGVRAVERLFHTLGARDTPVRGEIVGLAGNLTALAHGRRFLVRDLNRSWTRRRIASIRARPGDVEESEQLELLELIEDLLRGRESESIILDLHTTSSESIPFCTLGDTIRNREFARRLEIPVVLGIEEQIHGALLEYIGARGPVTVGVEGGQHDDPSSVDYHEHVLWTALVQAGCLDAADVPDYETRRGALVQARGGLSRFFEVRARRAVSEGDGFAMRPGFRNFEPVTEGQPLADDRRGAVVAPEKGRIFLPLYQEQGDDGFFIVRPIHESWLRLSTVLRHLRFDRLARLLPGVHRSRRRPDTLLVDRRVARWQVTPLFHLLGYRKRREALGYAAFSRRRHDLKF
ncbi:MAG: succinylglutamate desuccinylase/aspartoacylase family protein [marine benthic group bacterium]|nr:succinylglutamate desuccinylase/aspartoacylase family protein [Gemmatimonadota bacterium]MCL7937111.1 succinylglutamate desuccinylase/aspartoacylase family protein [Gemmatimonadota bacterium]MCL7977180.1 succinylglutamate desuccinylase/aspartoacylase family protein [Gemmatimonadota bacterium]MCL7986053.1 succinylglutamate desuccinylase/aspartoacylase family protein [Gemmatimonadota bacterium]